MSKQIKYSLVLTKMSSIEIARRCNLMIHLWPTVDFFFFLYFRSLVYSHHSHPAYIRLTLTKSTEATQRNEKKRRRQQKQNASPTKCTGDVWIEMPSFDGEWIKFEIDCHIHCKYVDKRCTLYTLHTCKRLYKDEPAKKMEEKNRTLTNHKQKNNNNYNNHERRTENEKLKTINSQYLFSVLKYEYCISRFYYLD